MRWELHVGTSGQVYLAEHNATKELRAIKLIKRNPAYARQEQDLMTEINVLKQLVAQSLIARTTPAS